MPDPTPVVAKPVVPPAPVPAVAKGPKEGDVVNVQFKITAVYPDKSLRLESVKGVTQTGTIVGTKLQFKNVHPDVVG